jgi:hypothetical protein
MIAVVCEKEVRKLSLPDVIISEIVSFCSWSHSRLHMWYIVASKFDSTRLVRAKQLDVLNTFLANDDEDDMLDLFNSNHCSDYVNHIRMNKTL